MTQYSGTVRWFNSAEGYGFLSREGGEDVFVHFGSILWDGSRPLSEGERVRFDIVQGDTGPQAQLVSRVTASR